MSPKLITISLVALLFVSTSQGGRIGPTEPGKVSTEVKIVERRNPVERMEGCEGLDEDDDCLVKRSLAAHVDYIYTQGAHN